MFIDYYLKISKVYAPFGDTLTITVDGEAIDTIGTFNRRINLHLPCSACPAIFADGALHTIGFDSTRQTPARSPATLMTCLRRDLSAGLPGNRKRAIHRCELCH
jgi:hypothetical protein